MLLALVAIQVFVQVWMMATDMPILGLVLCLWLSWKLGTLAGYADLMQGAVNHERLLAKEIAELQREFDDQPEDARLALAVPYTQALEQLTHLHQLLVAQCQLPMVKPKFRDMLPSPAKWLARRRERKIMATDKVVHA